MSVGLDLRAATRSDVGMVRERNEDASFAGRHVFAVADGLGGHRAGEVASSLALEPIAALDEMSSKEASRQVAEAVRRGNRAVFERAQEDAELKGMGTTLTAVVIHDGVAHVAHVGDSRCYLIRGSLISQLSRDHTLVARMVAEGKLTAEQAESHPQRSILTRALGAERDLDVDEVRVTLAPGDRLVLCSDGLTGVLSDEEIRTLVSAGADLDEICGSLIDEANGRGGPDNITVVVVDVGGSQGAVARAAGRRARGIRPRRRMPVRPLIWTALVALVVVGGLVGVRAWADRSFYVGADAGEVVIYRGLPVEFAGISLSTVEERTGMRLDEVAAWYLPRLENGVRASSLADARRIVAEQIPSRNARDPDAGEPEPTRSPTSARTPQEAPSP